MNNTLMNQKQLILKNIYSNSEDSVPSDESDDEEGIEILEEESNNITQCMEPRYNDIMNLRYTNNKYYYYLFLFIIYYPRYNDIPSV